MQVKKYEQEKCTEVSFDSLSKRKDCRANKLNRGIHRQADFYVFAIKKELKYPQQLQNSSVKTAVHGDKIAN